MLKRVSPYVIAFVAVAWVLWHTDVHQLLAAFQRAPIAWFVLFSAVLLIANLMADTFAMTSVLGWFGHRVPYRDLLFVRGSTYLLAVVNYHVGQAAIVGYLYRAQKVPFLRATGYILFIIGVNVGTLFLLASAGAKAAPGELGWLHFIPLGCAVGVIAYGALLWARPRALVERPLLQPLFQMGIVGHIKGVAVRLPHVGVLLVWHFFSLRLFGVQVTPLAALLYLPAYFAISSLPINVNGIGVAQGVAVAFFAPFALVPAGAGDIVKAQEAAVLAYSLGTSTVSIFLQVLLGLACLKRGATIGLGEATTPAKSEAPLEAASS